MWLLDKGIGESARRAKVSLLVVLLHSGWIIMAAPSLHAVRWTRRIVCQCGSSQTNIDVLLIFGFCKFACVTEPLLSASGFKPIKGYVDVDYASDLITLFRSLLSDHKLCARRLMCS